MKLVKRSIFFFSLFSAVYLLLQAFNADTGLSAEKAPQVSDHFDGIVYFNPDVPQIPPSPSGQGTRRGPSWWIWNMIFDSDRPAWPEVKNAPGPRPESRVQKGALSVTPVGHATFLVQMDGCNILIDPVWSDRCGPLPWLGVKRHRAPGIRFEDLPPIDIVLVSHNHYDHLDLPTLELLARKGTPRAIVPLGNAELVRESGIPAVAELDWWQSIPLTTDVKVTLVPAQHFSSRTLWDRNRALWGGFVISGPAGNVFYAGDTGYGPHFREIARRFSPFRAALLPIAPFRPLQEKQPIPGYRSIVHMGPAEAVKAHLDLGAPPTIAAHFQVFRLGFEGFDDAVNVLASTLKEHNLKPDAFVAPALGQAVNLPSVLYVSPSLALQQELKP